MTTTAGPRTPAEVARAAFDAVSRRDADALAELTTNTTLDDIIAIGEVRGSDAIRRFFLEMFAAFPDYIMDVERIVADGEAAAVQWRASGTFGGSAFQGIEPTGRRIEIRGVDVMEIADGHVQRNTIYYDGASFARQIGMLPRKGSGAERAVASSFNALTKLRKRIASR